MTFSMNNLDEAETECFRNNDRFIPSRSFNDEFASNYKISSCTSMTDIDELPNNENVHYEKILNQNFSNKKKSLQSMTDLDFKVEENLNAQQSIHNRQIPKVPFKILDAPLLQDDFYLNVVDWGKSDLLAVGLGNAAYTWSYKTNTIDKISQLEEFNLVTGIGWDQTGQLLGVGTLHGRVQLWDINKNQNIATFDDHYERVGSLSIFNNLLITGSRDKAIKLRDIRMHKRLVATYKNHKQEVCGLKWSPDGQYFASGGNDNNLFVYSPKTIHPLMKKKHKAAVKAIAWSNKTSGLLASGAGTADKCVRLWQVGERKLVGLRDTGSQICNIIFSKHSDELITTHGFSNNEINIWQLKGLKKSHTLLGHSSRVLYLSMSPDGEKIVTGAGDETLRFWNLNYPIPHEYNKVERKLNFSEMSLNAMR